MNKKKIIIIVMLSLLVIVCLGMGIYSYLYEVGKIELVNIELISYDEKAKNFEIKIERSINKHQKLFTCHAEGKNNKFSADSNNDSCTLTLKMNDSYNIYLTNEQGNKSSMISLNEKINGVLKFDYLFDTIYLIPGEETNIEYFDLTIDGKKDYNFKSENENVVTINNEIIKGIMVGETYIYSNKVNQKLKVVVSDIITAPYATPDKKEILTCHAYTEDENKLLDNILEYKVNKAGYQTRAGAVAAARFLTLEFAYRVPYFYELGRIPYENSNCKYNAKMGYSNINTKIADGEGRYYKKGLYLSESKKADITASVKGPAIWGCNLLNLESKPEYGFPSGKMMPNGLDCSGFVTWSLKQAGFEPGDVGAGEDPGRDCQCTDLGEFVPLSAGINSMKAGDLLNWWGHIAMFIGYDGDKYYVAESLSYISGVRAMIYTREELLKTFKYTVKMDNYYQEEGNYSLMW